jgi:hypothetical protein
MKTFTQIKTAAFKPVRNPCFPKRCSHPPRRSLWLRQSMFNNRIDVRSQNENPPHLHGLQQFPPTKSRRACCPCAGAALPTHLQPWRLAQSHPTKSPGAKGRNALHTGGSYLNIMASYGFASHSRGHPYASMLCAAVP